MTLAFAIPTIETTRLSLRAPAESDLASMTAFGASPRSGFVGGPYDHWGAWRVLLAGIGHWALRGYGYWSVDLRETGAFIGRVGVIYPNGTPEPELAWGLFDGFEGKGYGTEAVLAARRYADENFGLAPLASFIDPKNAASMRLALRVGAVLEGQMVEDGTTLHTYRHPALVAT